MDSGDKSLQAYETLHNSIPSIGFLSQKKRAIAFLKVTKIAQKMIDEKEISIENGLYLISVLSRKSADFQKAAIATALNLSHINRTAISDIGFKYANNMRCNLQILPIDDEFESKG